MCIGRIVVALVALPLTGGCMVVADGAAHPAVGLAPRPLAGQAVNHALLDEGELAKLVRQHFKSKPESPPRFGGEDQLHDVHAAPSGCAGVVYELQKTSYRAADVKAVAQQTWWTVGIRGAKVISVLESVVAVPTVAAADAAFAGFIQQWNPCNGTTVTTDFGIGHAVTAAISDVRTANSVLAATVQSHLVTTVTSARAVGVRANCLVEVDIAFFSDNKPDGTAVDIAHAMMDKVSTLS